MKKLHGVGKVTAAKMKRLGLESCEDLRLLGEEELSKYFGSFGNRLYNLSQGIDSRPVQTDRIRKSVSVENTFTEDLPSLESCLNALPDLERQLLKRIQSLKDNYQIQKQFVKIKFHDFVSTTVEMVSSSTDAGNYRTLCEQGFARGNKPVRLLGMGVKLIPLIENSNTQSSKIENNKDQLSLSLDS